MPHSATHVFEITFRSPPRLREVVRASPHEPLPTISAAESFDPAKSVREERQAIEQVLSQLRAAARQLGDRYESMAAQMRQATVELALAVAGRLVFDKLQAGEFPIEEMVRQAVARLPAAPSVRVHLHPDDLALLQRRLGEQPLSPEPDVQLNADATLKRGGCRAEADEIHVLADLSGQLAELRQQLLWSASHAQSGSGPSAP